MIKEALADLARSRRLNGDRSKTVGSSEVGQCMRKIAAVKHGWPTDPGWKDRWGAQVRGTTFEQQFWEPALRAKYGKRLMRSGPDQVSIADGFLSTTPDGWITGVPRDALRYLGVPDIGKSRVLLVECKTIDPRVGLKQAKSENVFQVQVQLSIVHKKTKFKPDWCLITYTDASFWDDVTEFAVKRDPLVYEKAQARAAQIMSSKPEELPPEGWIAGGTECEWCAYAERCGVVRRSVPTGNQPPVDPQFRAEITDMVRNYAKLGDLAEAADAEVRKAQQAIKDRLREKGIRKIPGLVTWTAVKGRTNYDMPAIREAAEAAGVDVQKFCTVGEPSDRLQVSALPAEQTGEEADG